MTSEELLECVRLLGCRVSLGTQDQLILDAPRGAVGSDLLSVLRQHRRTLVTLLKTDAVNASVKSEFFRQCTQPAVPKCIPLFAGWVHFRIWGWQRVVAPRGECLAAMDLKDYVESIGDSAIDSLVLPDGTRPEQKMPNAKTCSN